MKISSIQLFDVTIPPSRLRRATSLYTREACRTPTLLPLSEENQYTFVSFDSVNIFVNIIASYLMELSPQVNGRAYVQ